MKIMCVFKGVGEEGRGEEAEEGVDCACVGCAWRGRGATFEGLLGRLSGAGPSHGVCHHNPS